MDFDTTAAPPQEEIRGIPLPYWRAFFGKGDTYYMRQLQRLRDGERTEFNFAAFFLGYLWMLYRKMYLVPLALFLAILVEGTLEELILYFLGVGPDAARVIQFVITLVVGIIVGTYADRVYIWHAERQIRAVLAEGHHVDEVITTRIELRGGTSWAPVLLFIAAIALLIFAVSRLEIFDRFLQ